MRESLIVIAGGGIGGAAAAGTGAKGIAGHRP
jgi:hypothetical protein